MACVVGRRLVYAVMVGNLVLALLYHRGLVHPVLAGLLYWGSGAALVITIRRVETGRIPTSEAGGRVSRCSSEPSVS